MSHQPQPNVQLNCGNCGQSYLLPVEYQFSPHQCPHCGMVIGQQQMPAGQMPGQQTALQNPAGGPLPPGASGSTAGRRFNTMFIVRCIVGTLAVITIIGTIYYIITNKLNPPVRHIVELGEFGVGDLNDCGPFKVPAGKTLEVTFEIQTRSGQAAEFDLKRSDVNGAKITTGGVFTWPVPSDTKPGRYSFTVHYKDPGTKNSSGYSALYVDVTE